MLTAVEHDEIEIEKDSRDSHSAYISIQISIPNLLFPLQFQTILQYNSTTFYSPFYQP
jgi:hypothetical protein